MELVGEFYNIQSGTKSGKLRVLLARQGSVGLASAQTTMAMERLKVERIFYMYILTSTLTKPKVVVCQLIQAHSVPSSEKK